MFDIIIKEAASRFGLGDKAGPLVQMLLAYITNKDTGGLSGLMTKFANNGLGDIAKSWLGGGTNALPASASQLEAVLGGSNGLIGTMASKLGLGGSVVTSALGYLLPAVIGKLTPGGTIPTSFGSDVLGFITGGASALTGAATGAAGAAAGAVAGAAGAATVAASKVVGTAGHAASAAANTSVKAVQATGGGLMKWLPWLAVAAAGLFALSYCNKGGVDANKQGANSAANTTTTATATAPAAATGAATSATTATPATTGTATASAADAAKPAADAKAADTAPAGSGLVAFTHDGAPALKVYFDTGKTEVAKGFAETGKTIIDHLKANSTTKAIVSGFNDPTGNAAANAELSKNRAKAVRAALVAAGLAEDRVMLEKPTDTVGSALSNSEARRVEVTVRK